MNNRTDKIGMLLSKYNTMRIDVKNYGNKFNSIKFINTSDKDSFIDDPEWFSDSFGKGYKIESFKNSLDIKFKCVHNGNLVIFLRTKDIYDIFGNRILFNIRFTKFTINSKNFLEERNVVSHDFPLKFEKKVKNNEVIKLHVEWEPY